MLLLGQELFRVPVRLQEGSVQERGMSGSGGQEQQQGVGVRVVPADREGAFQRRQQGGENFGFELREMKANFRSDGKVEP